MRKINLICFSILILLQITCQKSDGINTTGGSETGTGGSLARFAIVGDNLFTVDNYNLSVFDVSTASDPQFVKKQDIGFGIETIFPKDTLLFLGSQIGMYIYDIKTPSNPQQISYYEHVYSCDPVVVEGKYAYVTLHSEDSWCGRITNELHVIDISDIYNPRQVKIYSMNSPRGLGIDKGELFVCDKSLKVYDAKDPLQLILNHQFNVDVFDVIPLDGLLIAVASDGLYQYSYNGNEINLLSRIPIEADVVQ